MMVNKYVFVATATEENDIDHILRRFLLSKALRVCAWMRRFMNNALRSHGNSPIEGPLTGCPLTTNETRRQEIFWTRHAQESCEFGDDRIALNLQPRPEGVMECCGRLQGEYAIYLPDDHLFL